MFKAVLDYSLRLGKLVLILVFFLAAPLFGTPLDEFFQKRPDIPGNISKWSGHTDKVWILREWIKITTERNEDYKTAIEILAEIEKPEESPNQPIESPSDGFQIPDAEPPQDSPQSSIGDGVNLPGVHWYSGDKDMIGNNGGWNVESVWGIDNDGQVSWAPKNAQTAKNHGLTNIIRLDYRGGLPVPKNPSEYKNFGDQFVTVANKFGAVTSFFVVGNEPNIESGISSQEYASAFSYIYGRKSELPAGANLLACCSANFSPDWLGWIEDMSSRINEVDGFVVHTYGDPTDGCEDPRKPSSRGGWPWDGGFQSFRDAITRIGKKWGDKKPIYITEFNTDVNGLEMRPNPEDNYKRDWIKKAFEAVRIYNSNRGSLPPVRALCWFVDRADDKWGSFALRNISQAREDMKSEFHNSANH